MGWGAGAGQGVSRWGTSGAVVLTLQFIGLQKLAKVCHPSFQMLLQLSPSIYIWIERTADLIYLLFLQYFKTQDMYLISQQSGMQVMVRTYFTECCRPKLKFFPPDIHLHFSKSLFFIIAVRSFTFVTAILLELKEFMM